MVGRFIRAALVGSALALAGSTASGAKAPDPIAIAVADSAHRTAENLILDDSRKPAAVLQFLGLRPGMKVADMFGLNKYWSEIIAPAVGPKGRVTVWEPTQFAGDKVRENFATFAAQHPNVSLLTSPFEAPALPKGAFDFMLINLNYHDTYWQSDKFKIPRMDPAAFLKVVYASMKPGGIVGVIDHVAKAGSDPRASVQEMHRIDPAVIRADFERAGFRLAATSDLLRNPADDHSKSVFEDGIRGHTDRAIFKFVKPRR